MKKIRVYLLVILVVSMGLMVTAYSQEDMEFVDNGAFPDPQRVPSLFNHDVHNEAAEIDECNECHHVYEDGVRLEDESSEGTMCSECHDLKAAGSAPGLMKAFHLNCKGCHIQRKSGPVMCGECHKK
jgi:hypothetical protein